MSERSNDSERDFEQALADAKQAVAASHAARAEAAERQAPRSRVPWLAASLVVLALVIAYDYVALTRVPEGLSPVLVEADLRFAVGTLVEEIEAFRTAEGRLPTRAELVSEELLEEGFTYTMIEGRFTITATDEVATVSYDSETPIRPWVDGGRP